MIRNEEREGTHQPNGESRRVVTTREMTRSQRQAISSDQTTQRGVWQEQRGVWQEEPGGVQDTVRAQRNDLENQEDSQGSAGKYFCFRDVLASQNDLLYPQNICIFLK